MHISRFGAFEPEDRCFVTFPSDPLTVPLPNNSYQIYYTPVDNDTREKYTHVSIHIYVIFKVSVSEHSLVRSVVTGI